MADDSTDIKGWLVNIEAAVGLLRVGRPRRTSAAFEARLERIERSSTPGK